MPLKSHEKLWSLDKLFIQYFYCIKSFTGGSNYVYVKNIVTKL